jgi:rubredoxin
MPYQSRARRKTHMNDRYVCLICGYTYDPGRGDEKGGVAPGTPGDQLPPGWTRPLCGKDQTFFARRDG